MAFNDKNLAYDFSLFEEKPRTSERKNNVLELPKSEKNTQKKTRAKSKVSVIMLTSFAIGALILGSIIYGQVQLNELTIGINRAAQQLNESESIYTQLQVKVESKLSLGAVEEYAKNNLQMEKINPYQIEYISLSTEDKGNVCKNETNMFNKIHNCLHKE